MTLTQLLNACALSLLLFTSTATAQSVVNQPADQPPSNKEDDAPQSAKELEHKAQAMLEQVIGEAASLRLPENRIRTQVNAAELLWPHDRERARQIFMAAGSDLASMISTIDPSDPQAYNLTQSATQLRQEMLQAIAQRDPHLALDFLHATHQSPPPQNGGYRQPDPDLELELTLAQQIAATDPQQAVRLAEETLRRGVSSNLTNLIEQVRQKDQSAASKIATETISKLRTANFTTDWQAINVAAYLLQATRPNETASNANGGAQIVELPDPRRLQTDDASRRELVGTLVNAAINATPAQLQSGTFNSLFSMLQQLMPEVEKYAPTQSALLRRKTSEFEERVNPQAKLWRKYQELMNTGTADALIEAATKAPPEMREQLYRNAAWKAFNAEGGEERARQIVTSYFENPQQREQMLKEFDNQRFWRTAQEGKIEQARQLLARYKSPEERVGMLLNLVRSAGAKIDKAAARQLLEEAWSTMGGRASNQNQFYMQTQIAQAYASIDPARSFEIAEANIDRLNELISAAAIVDGFGQDAFKDDELKMQGGYMWSSLIQQCDEVLAGLARLDFARARSDADRFQRTEARLTARLAVVRGAMSEPVEGGFRRLNGRRNYSFESGRNVVIID